MLKLMLRPNHTTIDSCHLFYKYVYEEGNRFHHAIGGIFSEYLLTLLVDGVQPGSGSQSRF